MTSKKSKKADWEFIIVAAVAWTLWRVLDVNPILSILAGCTVGIILWLVQEGLRRKK